MSLNGCTTFWCLLSSLTLNILFFTNLLLDGQTLYWNLSWTSNAAREAEEVAAISCSGHGRAFLDGVSRVGETRPVCECNGCFSGPDCSQLLPDCFVDVNSGDPYYLEPYWMNKAGKSAYVTVGWHRMGYDYSDGSYTSQVLESQIRKLHEVVGNAVTDKKFIIFGAGSTQLLNAAVHALSSSRNSSSSAARVVAAVPYYPLYKSQTEYFETKDYVFQGDTSQWNNTSDTMIEFVTAPNNPDGQMNKATLNGPNVKTIYDHAYYWPHYTPITSPLNHDLMLFTTSKLTGHAGSRFGWALIKDENVYKKMLRYMDLNIMGLSKDTQLRVSKLLNVAIEDGGKEFFEFGHNVMKTRWEKLIDVISLSDRFSLQKISTDHCNFFNRVESSSPAFAWVKCEREEDKDCYEVMESAKIIGRPGGAFQGMNKYVRLAMIRTQDEFDLMIQRLHKLVTEDIGARAVGAYDARKFM